MAAVSRIDRFARYPLPALLTGMLLALPIASGAPALAAVSSVTAGFDGHDQRRAIALGEGFIPADPAGAVGTTQFASLTNGGLAVYSKTGAELLVQSTQSFWQNAGATGFATRFGGTSFVSGNPRILFNKAANRWIATAFGGDVSFVNLAVSDTADATGPWKATSFLGFNGAAGGGITDFPTLAMDRNAVYIGTNDFDPGFRGSTLNVIPLADVFGAGAPVVANRATFLSREPYATDLGVMLQGANSESTGSTGWVVAQGILSNGVGFEVTDAGLGAAGAMVGARVDLAMQDDIMPNQDARQPDGSRTLDSLNSFITGGAYEHDGKIYFTRTVTTDAQDYSVVRVTVLDADDFSVVQQFDIDDGDYDHYYGSIAVNRFGAVVNYNRSGFDPATGNISVLANAYTLDVDGLLVPDANHLLKVSDNCCYSQGISRNRWGDYSQVTIDPTDARKFWSIGQYADFRDDRGGDGWASWISEITFADTATEVPEPRSWVMLIAGFGVVGAAARRRREVRIAVAGGD